MVVFFAAVLFLVVLSRFTQERQIKEDIESHKQLVKETNEERARTEQLAQDLLEQENRLQKKLDETQALLAELMRKNEQELKAVLLPAPPEPDEAEVEKLAKLPVEEIVTQLHTAIEDGEGTRFLTLAAALGKNRDEAFTYLMKALSETSDNSRKHHCLLMLSMLKDPRTLSLFQNTLRSETDILIRRAAASALGGVPDSSSVPILIDVLRTDRDWHVRKNAAAALGIIGDTRALAPLKQVYLHEENSMLRNYALAAFARIAEPGNPGEEPGIARESEDEGHRLIAVIGLKKIATPEAIATLQDLANSQTGRLADEARHALEELSKKK